MSEYRLTKGSSIIRTSDDAGISADPANRDYAAYLAWLAAGGVPDPYVAPPILQAILSQDLMAQFTTADLTAIKAAIDANIQFWGLWNALTTQKDPMIVNNARFLAGWNALIQVLGKPRMDAIATALGVTVA